jgi:prepilin-type N-terminal cleavage/methylation domain-containing protein
MRFRSNKGFTLIEVIVAMTILAFITAATFNVIFTSLKARNVSRERLQALELSSSVLDEIKSYRSTWTSMNGLRTWLVGKGYTAAGNVYDKVSTDSNNINYDIKVTINENIGVTGLFEISITAQSPNVSQISLETRLRGG